MKGANGTGFCSQSTKIEKAIYHSHYYELNKERIKSKRKKRLLQKKRTELFIQRENEKLKDQLFL